MCHKRPPAVVCSLAVLGSLAVFDAKKLAAARISSTFGKDFKKGGKKRRVHRPADDSD